MNIKINNYAFNAAAKTVTFTDFSAIRLDSVLLITNVTSNIIIYDFNDPLKGGSVLNNVLTLEFDTSLMNNADGLFIKYDDGSTVQKVTEQNSEDLSPLSTWKKQDDQISIIREENELNKVTEDRLSVADLLLSAMDPSQGTPLYVNLKKDLKQEPDGGLYLADMQGPYVWNSATPSSVITLDCTGFQSVLIQKNTTGVVTPYAFNDNANPLPTLAIACATSIPASTLLTAAGMYQVPVVSKYLRLVGPASAIQCIIYLSQSACFPELNATFNVTQIAGSPPPTANVAGTLVVGGAVQKGVARTTFPMPMAGEDQLTAPLTRTVLTDQLGRVQIGNVPSQNSTAVNKLGYNTLYRNILEVQDTSDLEGQTPAEIMLQILNELKILNLQMFELPSLQNRGLPANDHPDDLRKENIVF